MEKDLSLLHDYDYDDRFSFFDVLEREGGEREERRRRDVSRKERKEGSE